MHFWKHALLWGGGREKEIGTLILEKQVSVGGCDGTVGKFSNAILTLILYSKK